jgi:hypothetical protein
MTDSGLHPYAPLLLHLLIALALAGALTAVSVLVGWRRPSRAKQQPYECGMEPTGDARAPFSVKFYLKSPSSLRRTSSSTRPECSTYECYFFVRRLFPVS